MTSILIPGFDELADAERDRQAQMAHLARLPISVSLLAGGIRVIGTGAEAAEFADQLSILPVTLIGVDTEFRYDHPAILLSGKEYTDPSQIVPLVCSLVVLLDAGAQPDPNVQGALIRAVFDLRNPDVHIHLQRIFQLPVTWVAHSASAEYHALWACGIYPAEDRLVDTCLAAACLTSGKFHHRNASPKTGKKSKPGGDSADDQETREIKAHAISLVGQCQHYNLKHPYASSKDRLRRQFMELGPDDKLTDEMIAYAAADAEYGVRLHFAQQPDIQRQDLHRHLMTIEYPLAAAVARMELRGLPLDLVAIEQLYKPLDELIAEYGTRLQSDGIKPGSPGSFLDKMQSEGLGDHFLENGKLTTKKEVLQQAEKNEVHPAVRIYRKYNDYRRMRTLLQNLRRLRGPDGRVHGSLFQLESASSRIASRSPNLIGLPAVLRPIVAVPEGRVLIEIDYSQIEIGVAAVVWGDDELLRLYNQEDAYAAVAQRLFYDVLSDEERSLSALEFKAKRSDLRKMTKSILLGLLYGMGVLSLARRLKCSIEAAAGHLQRLFDTFPKARQGGELAIEHAIHRSYATSVSGFKRFIYQFHRRQQNALRNHPIQSSAAVIFKRALAKVDREYLGTDVWVLLPRHDSTLIECPASEEKRVIKRVKRLMIDAVKEVFPQMRARVEAKTGRSWPTERTLGDELAAIRKQAGKS